MGYGVEFIESGQKRGGRRAELRALYVHLGRQNIHYNAEAENK